MAEGQNAGDTQTSQVNMLGGGNAAGYKILLMNTNGPPLEPDKPRQRERQTAFKKLVDDLKPSIIFTQECSGEFLKCLGTPSEYAQCLDVGAQAGFIYNTNDFEADIITDNPSAKPTKNLMLNCPCTLRAAKPDRTSNESALDDLMFELNIKNPLRKDFSFTRTAQLKVTSMPDRQPAVGRDFSNEFRVKLNIENPLFNDFDFTDDRAQVVRFTSKPDRQPALDFLAISWHGAHEWTEEQKKTFIELLFTAVRKLQNKWDLPVIIGGDFNFDKKLWPELPEVFRIHDYTKSKRRCKREKPLIDFFFSTGGLNLTNTECYDLYRIKYLKPQGTDTKIRTWLKPGDLDLTEITINADGFNWTKVTILNPGGFDLTKLEIRNPEGVDWTEIIMIPEGSVLDEIKILNPEGFDLNQLMITKPEGFNLTNIETINPTDVDWTRIKIQIPPDFDWTEIKIQNPERFDLTKLKILKPEGFDCTKIEIQCSEGGQLTKLEILKPVGFDWTKIKIRKPKGFDLNKLEILMGKGQPLKWTKIKINYEVSDDGTEIKIRQPEVFDWTNIKILNPEGFDLTKLEILESKFFNLSTIKILNPQGYDLVTQISNATDFFDHDPVQAYLTPQPDIEAITEGLAAASLE